MTTTTRRTIAVATKTEAPPSTRITCRVCRLPAIVSIHHPALLCINCLIDLDITAAHVAAVRAAAERRNLDARDAWDAALSAADGPSRARWAKVEQARTAIEEGKASEAAFAATWHRARAAGDAFAALLLAWEAKEEIGQACIEQLAWCDAAEREIAAART